MTDPSATVTADRPPWSQVPHALIRDTNLSLSARVVYDDLMARADSDGQCFPGIRTIADDIGIAPGTAQKAVNDLEMAGWITVTRQGRKTEGPQRGQRNTNLYRVHYEPVPKSDTGPYQKSEQARTDNRNITRTKELEPPNKNHLATVNVAWEFYTNPEGFNLPTGTAAQRKRVGRLARELNAKIEHEGGMTDTLQERADAWPVHFPDATLTPEAFEKHFTQLGRPPLRRSKQEVEALIEQGRSRRWLEQAEAEERALT